jgi:hypothetical protein
MIKFGMRARRLMVILIASVCVLSINQGLAIDGDVEYSAPYIMVDPETGQIVTVNPGPRLKAHETAAEMLTDDTTQAAGTRALSAAKATGTLQDRMTSTPDTLPSIIITFACLFMVVCGFLIKRLKEKQGT